MFVIMCIEYIVLYRLGYDPGLVNPYLNKVVESLGRLDYDDVDVDGTRFFQITGAVSNHGEQLPFKTVPIY